MTDLSAYERAVLAVVDQVPPGRLVTYGDLAELAQWGTARTAGTVLRRHGHQVAWHRVVRADGSMATAVAARQLLLLAAEGVLPGRAGRLDLVRLRWDGSPET